MLRTMSKTNRNNFIRAILFLIITALLLFYLLEVFSIAEADENKRTFNTFYSEKDNTYDGVYIGASSAKRYWNASLAFQQHGFAIGSMTMSGQPLVTIRYLMDEIRKTQNPKLYIIELRWCHKNADFVNDYHIRTTLDSMKQSRTRLQAINASVDFALKGSGNDVSGDDMLSYYLPIIKYHDRWKGNLDMDDILMRKPITKCKGYTISKTTFKQVPLSDPIFTDSVIPMAKETEAALNELLDYCDQLDADVLFVLSPYVPKPGQLQRLNHAVEVVTERGYPVLNCISPEISAAIGMNYQTDFYNFNHTNYLGAEKYTTYLASYIKKNYRLSDHRGDQDYDSWEEAYSYYVSQKQANGRN